MHSSSFCAMQMPRIARGAAERWNQVTGCLPLTLQRSLITLQSPSQCLAIPNPFGCRKVAKVAVQSPWIAPTATLRNTPSSLAAAGCPPFGFLFDIDGVFLRGRDALPAAGEALQRLLDSQGRFRVPTVFVTNAGNALRWEKASTLSKLFNVKIDPDQVILAHSPLQMFRQYQNKHFLVSGQGPAAEIAESVGFTNIITMEQLRNRFPMLDMVDMRRRDVPRTRFEHDFQKIEGILLLGEPVNWETSLQLIVDVLMTDGQPTHRPVETPSPHLPILACNMDLLWMAEAPLPRIGHGSFLLCLEALYHKLTGDHISYSALVGKPSEATYHHAEYCLSLQAAAILGIRDKKSAARSKCTISRIYAIGDNPDTDVFGGNLYDKFLQRRRTLGRQSNYGSDAPHLVLPEVGEVDIHAAVRAGATSEIAKIVHHKPVTQDMQESMEEVERNATEEEQFAETCVTILVESGVYSAAHAESQSQRSEVSHQHRDFHHNQLGLEHKESSGLYQPKYICKNVLDAVDKVFSIEGFGANAGQG
ncbi:haloacid dehalogenase-like hydrolase domain-containing 5 [Paramacrobiotus metropolitanus]|uniref:haloacid dehalogenase-like hydrolase domain-containing 5 n=1 Tax=Paramacrobiotus metropolitanus TaxID=2943436 RepID=UPI002445CF27|nr:haloacid dehalogenase-like hydrolase domain-containing 5 [Paramacrobiotus metropolitanus]XP_055353338.1 haloacid dehalogenase-like hydrolase domain-containing 5 [Paramacrobiotus metropolitanus]XP_055353339.1 haloacid dehalogenase-like hydrolase domain-containing 5 [Paramacrobiotus metropolitanus]